MYKLCHLLSQNQMIVSCYLLQDSENRLNLLAKLKPYYIKEPKVETWEIVHSMWIAGSVDTVIPNNCSSPPDYNTATIALVTGNVPIVLSPREKEIDGTMRISRIEEITEERAEKILNSTF